jgi:hypothetical protein
VPTSGRFYAHDDRGNEEEGAAAAGGAAPAGRWVDTLGMFDCVLRALPCVPVKCILCAAACLSSAFLLAC